VASSTPPHPTPLSRPSSRHATAAEVSGSRDVLWPTVVPQPNSGQADFGLIVLRPHRHDKTDQRVSLRRRGACSIGTSRPVLAWTTNSPQIGLRQSGHANGWSARLGVRGAPLLRPAVDAVPSRSAEPAPSARPTPGHSRNRSRSRTNWPRPGTSVGSPDARHPPRPGRRTPRWSHRPQDGAGTPAPGR
jgi:hypothetical protein